MNFKEALEAAIEENQEQATPWLVDDLDIDFEEIEDDIVDTGRWEEFHRAIYKSEGRFWAVNYAMGSTEYQDSNSYGTEIYEVEPFEVTVTKYRKKK